MQRMPTFSFPRAVALVATLLAAGCGGDVVVDPPSGGGGPSSSGGPRTCLDHGDCGSGEVCIFATGECAPSCDPAGCDSCGVGRACNSCATSSCPGCRDCVAACPLSPPGTVCDDDDPCPANQACDFTSNTCRTVCTDGSECTGVEQFCASCLSGSCCGCLDCVNLCTSSF